jgi:hypothetical protein
MVTYTDKVHHCMTSLARHRVRYRQQGAKKVPAGEVMSLLTTSAICCGFQLTSASSSSSSAVAIRSVAGAASSAVTVSSFLTTLAGTLSGNTSCSHKTGWCGPPACQVCITFVLDRRHAACNLVSGSLLQPQRCMRCSRQAGRRSHLPLGAE